MTTVTLGAQGRALRLIEALLFLAPAPVREDAPLSVSTPYGQTALMVEQVLSNALKFSPAGSELVLAVSSQRTRNRYQVRVEIIDQGPGVSPEDRARIFEAGLYAAQARGKNAVVLA